jgi:SAM-dependent methyltransferase
MAEADGHDAAVQRRYFEVADVEHFHWTTAPGEGIADTEEALLAPLLDGLKGPCLEIGCGEGNNLLRLARCVPCVGVDLFPAKLRFAASKLPATGFAAADAGGLPFRTGVFRTVLVRDLLHHVPVPEQALAEAVRVLAPGGRLHLIEPNGRNPLVGLHARMIPAEAAARRSAPASLSALVARFPLRAVRVVTAQPLPLSRLVLHYRFGLPALARVPAARRALAAVEAAAGRLLPRSRWAYVAITADRV